MRNEIRIMTLHSRFPGVRRAFIVLLAASLFVAVPATAASYAIDAARSTLSVTFKLSGVPAEGQFKKYSGGADFDPANPARTNTRFEIEVAGFDLGDPDYNAELGKEDWFDTARYPKASFVSKAVKPAGPGKLDVSGTLTIKGRSADVRIPVAYRQEGPGYVFEGTAPVRRLAFTLGEGEWRDTAVLEDEVRIRFRLALVPRK
jgi:polyisoprenoid-binding protein YceI